MQWQQSLPAGMAVDSKVMRPQAQLPPNRVGLVGASSEDIVLVIGVCCEESDRQIAELGNLIDVCVGIATEMMFIEWRLIV